jgi:putative tricarboxylic transport membrane protein
MRIRVLIEGILLFVIGLISVIEGVRLIIYKNLVISYDPVGPSFFVLLCGICLMIVAVLYVIVNYRKPLSTEKMVADVADKEMTIRLISAIVVCVAYIFLINIVGYLIATVVFLLLQFRITGVKNWLTNCLISIILTALFYFGFIVYCDMPFPKGMIFK